MSEREKDRSEHPFRNNSLFSLHTVVKPNGLLTRRTTSRVGPTSIRLRIQLQEVATEKCCGSLLARWKANRVGLLELNYTAVEWNYEDILRYTSGAFQCNQLPRQPFSPDGPQYILIRTNQWDIPLPLELTKSHLVYPKEPKRLILLFYELISQVMMNQQRVLLTTSYTAQKGLCRGL